MGFQENVPIYIQIAADIREQIISGKIKSGEKIKSVREYSILYAVTALTAQRAMQLLETEGVIEVKRGIGSFVAHGIRQDLEKRMVKQQVGEFTARMKSMGITNESILSAVQEALTNG